MLQDADRADDVRWLPGAKLNIAESALWGRDDSAKALCWADESASQSVHSMTWADLRAQSSAVAAALQAQGLQPGQNFSYCGHMENLDYASCSAAPCVGCHRCLGGCGYRHEVCRLTRGAHD